MPDASCQEEGCHPGTNLISNVFPYMPVHNDFACSVCHASSDPNVTTAVDTGDKRCVACHPDAGHEELHITVEPPVGCQDIGCHPGTNLFPIHPRWSASSATSHPTRS